MFVVHAAERTVRRLRLRSYDELLAVDLGADGEPVVDPLVLVCGHGRRDACCARLGRPLYDALLPELAAESLWLSSHQGGHRFAPNLLWLPDGLLFGRVEAQVDVERGPVLPASCGATPEPVERFVVSRIER